jgi:frataxin
MVYIRMIGNRLIRSVLLLRPLVPAALARTTATATAPTANVTRITTALTDDTTHRRLLFTSATSISNTCTSTYNNINIDHRRAFSGCSQFFDNESEFHTVADEMLEDIQDAVDVALEEYYTENDDDNDNDDDEFETVYASGVLNMTFPPYGTWVLNKQTPNRQIWWSSPISGPRRYEYDENISEWMYTRAVNNNNENENENDTTSASGSDSDSSTSMTLTNAIKDEIRQIYGIELDL